jgi:hypothetical protein
MSKQFGVSSLLAAAASMLVVGMVAVGSTAQAASEEEFAAPRGAFVSTIAVPNDAANIVYRAGNRPALIVTASEEDAAVPRGAFTSTMTAPDNEGEAISVASNSAPRKVAAKPGDVSNVSLSEIVALGLE